MLGMGGSLMPSYQCIMDSWREAIILIQFYIDKFMAQETIYMHSNIDDGFCMLLVLIGKFSGYSHPIATTDFSPKRGWG